MKRRCTLWNIGIGCLIGAAVATTIGVAHHLFSAQYDADTPITVRGWVTKVEWTNPHTYFYLDVEDEDNGVSEWAFEMGSPVVLQRFGWTSQSLEIGDQVEVEGYLARDGSQIVNAASVLVLGSGLRLQAMSAPPTN